MTYNCVCLSLVVRFSILKHHYTYCTKCMNVIVSLTDWFGYNTFWPPLQESNPAGSIRQRWGAKCVLLPKLYPKVTEVLSPTVCSVVKPATWWANFHLFMYRYMVLFLLQLYSLMTGDLGRHGRGALYKRLSKKYKRVAQKPTQVNLSWKACFFCLFHVLWVGQAEHVDLTFSVRGAQRGLTQLENHWTKVVHMNINTRGLQIKQMSRTQFKLGRRVWLRELNRTKAKSLKWELRTHLSRTAMWR